MKFHIHCTVILTAACYCLSGSPATPVEQTRSIPFRQATGNYFLVTTYTVAHTPTYFIVNNYNAFDSLFHWAAVMRQDTLQVVSRPEMDSSFIVAVVVRGAFSITMNIQKITLASGVLSVYYGKADSVSHPSYQANNRTLVLVSNCAYDSIQFYENGRFVKNPQIDRR